MTTLASGGRITVDVVDEQIARLQADWQPQSHDGTDGDGDTVAHALGADRAAQLDLFDRVQLAEVLRVCRSSRSLSEAGRTLFAVSRQTKSTANDADRLRKYLSRFDLTYPQIGPQTPLA